MVQRLAFTDAGIKHLAAPESGTAYYWDTNTQGLGIRVGAGGAKTFVLLVKSGRRKTLGRYPTIGLSDARMLSKTLLAQRTLGKHIDLPKSKMTVEDARDAFLEDAATRLRPRTVADYKRLLTNHLPKGRLGELDRKNLLERVKRLQDTPAEQYHAQVAFQVFLRWCVNSGHLAVNPIAGLRSQGSIGKRERVLSHDELAEVIRKAIAFPFPMGQIVLLILLTGQRPGEITKLRRSFFADDTITIPASLAKNGVEHTFPYSAFTVQVIETVPQTGDVFFPGRSGGYFQGVAKAKAAFDATLERVAPFTLHDLRRTFVSLHAELGTPIHVVERQINHVSGSFAGVRGVYNRWTYLPEMRDACLKYENFLRSLARR